MDKEEEMVTHIPFPRLAELCKDPEFLAKVLSTAVQLGIQIGRQQTHEHYHTMFAGYNKLTIDN